jgi:hypothetical protein
LNIFQVQEVDGEEMMEVRVDEPSNGVSINSEEEGIIKSV